MKIAAPSCEILWITPDPIKTIEYAARTCYKSEDKITDVSCETFVANLVKSGHLAMLEHASASVKIVCDRAIANQIERHRIFSFAQESTRYCNYSKDKFQNEITVIRPTFKNDIQLELWEKSVRQAEESYVKMIQSGLAPQTARSVLPLCLKTELVITGNLRQWRHFLAVRMDVGVDPQMLEICKIIKPKLLGHLPEFIFD